MFDMNSTFVNKFFRPVDNMVWDMMSGRVGVQTRDGILTLELDNNAPEESTIVSNPFEDFSVALPAFAQSIPTDQINIGDMIYSSARNGIMGWVVKKTEKSYRVMKTDGTVSQWNPPKVQMMGFDSGVMIVRSLINTTGGSQGLGDFQNMMMPMLAMGMLDDQDMTSKMMPLMLMTQTGMGGNAQGMMPLMMNMMMMKMMMGDSAKPTGLKNRINHSKANFFDRD